MPIPARISIVTLGVADVARSAAFYETLGWTRASSSMDEIVWFKTADTNLGLFGYEALAEDAGVAASPRSAYNGVTLAINVESEEAVAENLAAAEAAGARIVKPAARADWGGVSGYFADPDGYLWEIAHNPHFPIDADGRSQIP